MTGFVIVVTIVVAAVAAAVAAVAAAAFFLYQTVSVDATVLMKSLMIEKETRED